MVWWYWMVLGAIFFGTELMLIDAQFYLVFMGISAAIVGLLGMFGIAMPEWAEWVTFGVLSLVSFFTFRKSLYNKIRGGVEGFRESLAGETITVSSDLAAGSDGRIAYRGSEWTALNVGTQNIAGGSKAKVVKVDGLTLHISAD